MSFFPFWAAVIVGLGGGLVRGIRELTRRPPAPPDPGIRPEGFVRIEVEP
jgi:hypothetical protein